MRKSSRRKTPTSRVRLLKKLDATEEDISRELETCTRGGNDHSMFKPYSGKEVHDAVVAEHISQNIPSEVEGNGVYISLPTLTNSQLAAFNLKAVFPLQEEVINIKTFYQAAKKEGKVDKDIEYVLDIIYKTNGIASVQSCSGHDHPRGMPYVVIAGTENKLKELDSLVISNIDPAIMNRVGYDLNKIDLSSRKAI